MVIVTNNKLFEHILNVVVYISFVSLPFFVCKSDFDSLPILFYPFMLHITVCIFFLKRSLFSQ